MLFRSARPAKPNPLKGAKSGFVVSQFFDVRYDGGSSVSVPGLYVTPGMEVHSFTIWDRVNGNGARFRYVGAAGGFGPKFGHPAPSRRRVITFPLPPPNPLDCRSLPGRPQ